MNVLFSEDGRLRNGWRFVISVVFVILAEFLARNIAYTVARGDDQLLDVIYRPLWMVLQIIAFLALTRRLDKPTISAWQYIGLPRSRWLYESFSGALLGFVMVGLAVAAMAILGHVSVVSLRLNPRTLTTGIVVFLVILAAAMAEELAFRGYPFQRLVAAISGAASSLLPGTDRRSANRIGAVGAIFFFSALFGAVHLSNPHISDNQYVRIFAFSNTLFIGIVLAIAYLRTRALWLPWGLHFGWNATLGLFFGLPVSGIEDFSVIVHSRVTGPEWLFGGEYGLEGGFLGTLVILLGLIYILVFVHPAPEPIGTNEQPQPEFPQESIQSNIGSASDL
jgi:membrane protease YdiL (CAAX protease family)